MTITKFVARPRKYDAYCSHGPQLLGVRENRPLYLMLAGLLLKGHLKVGSWDDSVMKSQCRFFETPFKEHFIRKLPKTGYDYRVVAQAKGEGKLELSSQIRSNISYMLKNKFLTKYEAAVIKRWRTTPARGIWVPT